MVFHGFWLVSMVFQTGFMVLWFLVGFHGFSRWFHGFSWFLVPPVREVTFLHHRRFVRSPCWLRTPQNCILARQSSLGLAGRSKGLFRQTICC